MSRNKDSKDQRYFCGPAYQDLISALRYIGVASLIITISLLAVRNTSTWLTERSKITVPPTDQIEARISNNESANQFLITGLLP